MADEVLRRTGRTAAATGAPDDEARALRTRVRAGEAIYDRDLPALKVAEGTRANVMATLEHARIPEQERGLLFLRGLREHYQSARSHLVALDLLRPVEMQGLVDAIRPSFEGLLGANFLGTDDVAPPSSEECADIVLGHFENHPAHLEAIRNMGHPVLQLEPVFAHAGQGFRRISQAINEHGIDMFLRHSDMSDRASEHQQRIVGWRIAITEGEPHLYHRYISDLDSFGVALDNWKASNPKNLRLPNSVRYALLPKRLPGESVRYLDGDTISFLEDDSPGPSSTVAMGRSLRMGEGCEFIRRDSTQILGPEARHVVFRPSIVIPVPRPPSKPFGGDTFRPSVIAPIEP